MTCRFFYASSACIYPENKQLDTEVEGGGLLEKDAWPAQVCPLLACLQSVGPTLHSVYLWGCSSFSLYQLPDMFKGAQCTRALWGCLALQPLFG